MRILLDTHIVLWALLDSNKLSKKAHKIIESASEVYISPVSLWEIAIKVNIGKLQVDIIRIKEKIFESNYIELPLKFDHIFGLNNLPDIHKDPFDRILIAQALSEPLKLITADVLVKKYSELVELV
jgi:PIN domain nuclease of toxin-antitoxin system